MLKKCAGPNSKSSLDILMDQIIGYTKMPQIYTVILFVLPNPATLNDLQTSIKTLFWTPRHVQSTIIGNTTARLFNISYLKVAIYMRSPMCEKITHCPHLCTHGAISSDGYCIQAATTCVTADTVLIARKLWRKCWPNWRTVGNRTQALLLS